MQDFVYWSQNIAILALQTEINFQGENLVAELLRCSKTIKSDIWHILAHVKWGLP